MEVVRQILSAVGYCHRNGVCHRDARFVMLDVEIPRMSEDEQVLKQVKYSNRYAVGYLPQG